MSHFIKVCPKGHVITQCRCRTPNKARIVVASADCPKCRREGRLVVAPKPVESMSFLELVDEYRTACMQEGAAESLHSQRWEQASVRADELRDALRERFADLLASAQLANQGDADLLDYAGEALARSSVLSPEEATVLVRHVARLTLHGVTLDRILDRLAFRSPHGVTLL